MSQVIDEALLDEFRTEGPCELCGKWAPRREGHHVITKGMGGGRRYDIRENLVAVSAQGTWVCQCHRRAQNYEIPRACVLAVIALREGLTLAEIEEIHRRLKWGRRT